MFVQGYGQKSEQKHRKKNFAKLHNHLPLLTMASHFKTEVHDEANSHTIKGNLEQVWSTSITVNNTSS